METYKLLHSKETRKKQSEKDKYTEWEKTFVKEAKKQQAKD